MAVRPEYSERTSEEYDRYRVFQKNVLEKYMSTFADLAELLDGMRVLDGGAGTGRFAQALSEHYKVTALDCSREMILKGVAKSKKIRWVQGDIMRTPFKPKRFDCVFLAYVMHQVPDFNVVIEEMRRISPKLIIVTTDMYHRLPTLLDQAFPGVIEADVDRFPPVEDIEGACVLAGFDRVRARRILVEERLSKEAYMEKIRHKYLSTFDLIPPEEYEAGVKKMESILAKIPGEELLNRIQATFVSAAKL